MVARNRFVVSGTIFGGEEVWSCGFSFGGEVVSTQTGLQEWVDTAYTSLAADWATDLDPIRGLMGEDVAITNLAAYYYPAPGPAVALAENALTSPLEGDTPTRMPSYTAQVVSLLTSVNTASGRGRFYWPALGAQLAAGGRFGGATGGSTILTAWTVFFIDLLAAAGAGADLELGVYSPTLDTFTPVNRLRVGNVPDVQRRRKDDLVETYTTLNFPT